MLVRHLKDCTEFIAGDGSILREILHGVKMHLPVNYSLAHAKVPAGQTTLKHRLAACELYYIIAGIGRMHINEESCDVAAGCTIYIPPGSTQYITNTSDSELEFLCIVEPAWKAADEEVLDS
jgi:mannose-6-phosphate isomerase-like protein (cupin superfamily)